MEKFIKTSLAKDISSVIRNAKVWPKTNSCNT
jgi:hypothetical protein